MLTIMLYIVLVSYYEGFLVDTQFDAHALNLYTQYLTLLKVYKLFSWTSTLYTSLVICTTSFMFVQLMYRLLRCSKRPWVQPCISYGCSMLTIMLRMVLVSYYEGFLVVHSI